MNFNPDIHEKIIVDGIEKGYRLKQVEAAPEPIRVISVGSFRRRLFTNEKVAIKTSGDPVMQVFEEDLLASSYVDLDHDATVEGLTYLQGAGVLTAERVAAIRADGKPEEKPVLDER